MTIRANAALLTIACAACTADSDDDIELRNAAVVDVLTDGSGTIADDGGTTGGDASSTDDGGGASWTTVSPVDLGVGSTYEGGGSTYGDDGSTYDGGSTYASATWTSGSASWTGDDSTFGSASASGSASWTGDDTWTTFPDDSTSGASWTSGDSYTSDDTYTSDGDDGTTGDPDDPDDPDEPDEDPCEGDECPPGECGDGATGSDEDCDDGNTDEGDGCSSACEIEDDNACGDGWVGVEEECDDGNEEDGDGCASDCTVETVSDCGDGIVSPDEECDDGNDEDDDGCSSVCEDEDDDVCVVSDPLPTDPEAAPRRFCSTDTEGLHLEGFVLDADCEGDPDEVPQLTCADPPPQPANAAGGTHHAFVDGETSEWTTSIALKISFSKVPVLSELGAKYEPKFTHKSTVETRIEANFDSGEQPSVFVHDANLPEGAWMYAGTKVSARRAAKTVKTNTLDNKFSMELWVVEGSTTKSDGRFKEIWTSIKYRKGDGPFGAAVKAKEIIGRNDLADDKPVRTSEVVEALRKQMASDEIKAKLVKEHAAALSAAGYVWAEKQIDYGCGLGPDGKGGITEVCIVPWCHYDAIVGRKNFFGHYMESVSETTSGLFRRAVEGGATYVIGNGSAVNPNTQIIAPKNCSRYEIQKDSFVGLWTGYPVWEAGGWGKRNTNETVASPIMATGAKNCGFVGKKCFFTTRTLDAGNHLAVFAWQANQQTDAERSGW